MLHTQRAQARRRTNRHPGFTLIELLVVIVIIGVLTAIAVPVYLSQEGKGSDAALKSDMLNTAAILAQYSSDNPGGTSVPTQAALTSGSYGLQVSPGDTLTVTGSPQAGWCIQGNDSSGGAVTTSFWYDSTAGDMLSTKSTTPPGSTAAAACYPANVSASTAQKYVGPAPGSGGGGTSAGPAGAVAESNTLWPDLWAENSGSSPATWHANGMDFQPWDTTANHYYGLYWQTNGGTVHQGDFGSESEEMAYVGDNPPFYMTAGPDWVDVAAGATTTFQAAVYSQASGQGLLSYSKEVIVSCQPTAAWLSAHPTATTKDSYNTFTYTWDDGTKCYFAYENGLIAPST